MHQTTISTPARAYYTLWKGMGGTGWDGWYCGLATILEIWMSIVRPNFNMVLGHVARIVDGWRRQQERIQNSSHAHINWWFLDSLDWFPTVGSISRSWQGERRGFGSGKRL